MILRINVHPISKKVMQKELCKVDKALFLDRSNIYYDHILMKRIPPSRYGLYTTMDSLTEYIEINVTGRHLHVSNYLGYYLYKLHKDECYRYMYAYVEAGGNAMDGLRSWCNRYGIDDDDIDLSSLYRMYNRYTHKKGYMYNVRKLKKTSKFYSEDELRTIYSKLVLDVIDELYYYNDKPIVSMYMYMYMYLLRELSGMSADEIASRLGVKAVTVYKGVNKAAHFLQQHGVIIQGVII